MTNTTKQKLPMYKALKHIDNLYLAEFPINEYDGEKYSFLIACDDGLDEVHEIARRHLAEDVGIFDLDVDIDADDNDLIEITKYTECFKSFNNKNIVYR